MVNDREKTRIRSKFPRNFQGVGTLKNYEVEFHIDKNVTLHVQTQRQVPHGWIVFTGINAKQWEFLQPQGS